MKPLKESRTASYIEDEYLLFEVLSSLKNVEETKILLREILTPSELLMLKRRWHIACT